MYLILFRASKQDLFGGGAFCLSMATISFLAPILSETKLKATVRHSFVMFPLMKSSVRKRTRLRKQTHSCFANWYYRILLRSHSERNENKTFCFAGMSWCLYAHAQLFFPNHKEVRPITTCTLISCIYKRKQCWWQ